MNRVKNKNGRLIPVIFLILLSPPLIYILYQGLVNPSSQDDFNHFLKIIPNLTLNTIKLGFWTILFSLIFGLSISIIISLTNYKYSEFLRSVLYLPLGMPLYIGSFIYLGFTDYGSWINSLGLKFFNFNLGQMLESSGPIWIGFVFSLFLSPYLTLPLSSSMKLLGENQWPIAKTMGLNNFQVIRKIILPSLKGWIIGPIVIILMEVFSDFGGVSAFNYDTLSYAIYTSWTGFYSFALALKISFILLIFSLLLFFMEHKLRSNHKNKYASNIMSHPPIHLSKKQELFCHIPIGIYLFFSLFIPFLQLIIWSSKSASNLLQNALQLGFNSFGLAFMFGFLFIIISIFVTFNLNHNKLKKLKPLALLGYSTPGPIIALSMIGIATLISNTFNLELANTGFVILFCGVFYKYILVAEKNWSNAFTKIPTNTINSAKIFAKNKFHFFQLTYLPIIKSYLIPIFLIVFLEIIKELPITLMLRPFSFQTLPIKIYELTSEGEWEQAAIYSLSLLVIGLPLSYIVNKRKLKS